MISLVLAGAALSAAGVVAHGAFHRNSPFFGRALGRLPTTDREVALTFDDGPNPVATPAILDVLRSEGVTATFFLLGRHVERWPDLAARVAREGHVVGNHGYHHRRLHLRSRAFARLDIALGTDSVVRTTGMAPRLFRAPHGARNPWVSRLAAERGQRIVGWTLGVWDSDKPGAPEIVRRAVSGTRPGTILLLHDGDGYDPLGDRTQTAEALPSIIRALREQGYRFVGVPA